jgi:hypothetical protein
MILKAVIIYKQVLIIKKNGVCSYNCKLRFLFATGNIVLNYALREQPLVNGLIISAPFLRTPDPIPAAELLLARIMKNVWGLARK